MLLKVFENQYNIALPVYDDGRTLSLLLSVVLLQIEPYSNRISHTPNLPLFTIRENKVLQFTSGDTAITLIQNNGEIHLDVKNSISAGWMKWRQATGTICDFSNAS